MKAMKVMTKITMDSTIIPTEVDETVALTIITTGEVNGNTEKKFPAQLSGLSIIIAEMM